MNFPLLKVTFLLRGDFSKLMAESLEITCNARETQSGQKGPQTAWKGTNQYTHIIITAKAYE